MPSVVARSWRKGIREWFVGILQDAAGKLVRMAVESAKIAESLENRPKPYTANSKKPSRSTAISDLIKTFMDCS